jgi:hypothetical protein
MIRYMLPATPAVIFCVTVVLVFVGVPLSMALGLLSVPLRRTTLTELPVMVSPYCSLSKKLKTIGIVSPTSLLGTVNKVTFSYPFSGHWVG